MSNFVIQSSTFFCFHSTHRYAFFVSFDSILCVLNGSLLFIVHHDCVRLNMVSIDFLFKSCFSSSFDNHRAFPFDLIHCDVRCPFKKSTYDAKELQLTNFLQAKGAVHQFSCPHRPQQNFVIERKHQHLLNVARALLFQSKVPLRFWGECVSTSAYLINIIPSPGLIATW